MGLNKYYGSGSNYADSFRASLRAQPVSPYVQNNVTNNNRRKWIIIGIIIFAVLTILVIVLSTVLPALHEARTEAEFVENSYNELDEVETLSGEYSAEAAKNEHAEYYTEITKTAYVELSPKNVCDALNIDKNSLANPCSSALFVKTSAMNSNALDYYLDQGNVVVMQADYDGVGEKTLLIYGRTDFLYGAFDIRKVPNEISYMVRSEIFNNIIGVPKFYVLKGITDGA